MRRGTGCRRLRKKGKSSLLLRRWPECVNSKINIQKLSSLLGWLGYMKRPQWEPQPHRRKHKKQDRLKIQSMSSIKLWETKALIQRSSMMVQEGIQQMRFSNKGNSFCSVLVAILHWAVNQEEIGMRTIKQKYLIWRMNLQYWVTSHLWRSSRLNIRCVSLMFNSITWVSWVLEIKTDMCHQAQTKISMWAWKIKVTVEIINQATTIPTSHSVRCPQSTVIGSTKLLELNMMDQPHRQRGQNKSLITTELQSRHTTSRQMIINRLWEIHSKVINFKAFIKNMIKRKRKKGENTFHPFSQNPMVRIASPWIQMKVCLGWTEAASTSFLRRSMTQLEGTKI